MDLSKSSDADGIIVEFHQVGNSVKVSAINTVTMLEVSIVAPVNCTEKEMTDNVLRKLAYVEAKGDRRAQPRRTDRDR